MSMIGSLAGGVIGAMGAMKQAQGEAAKASAAAQAATYNAMVATRNKGIIRAQTGALLIDQIQTDKRTLHSFRAMYGHSGVDMAGTALDVLYDTSIEQQMAEKRIIYKGQLAQLDETDKINLLHMEADADVKAGEIAVQGAQLSAISSIIGGITGAVNGLSASGGGLSVGG